MIGATPLLWHCRRHAPLVDRLAEIETADYPTGPEAAPDPRPPREVLTETVVTGLHAALTRGRTLTLARFELALEANRRPELRARYDTLAQRFRRTAAALLTAAGSADPDHHAALLMAWCDGVLFHTTAGSAQSRAPSPGHLREHVDRLLTALLGT